MSAAAQKQLDKAGVGAELPDGAHRDKVERDGADDADSDPASTPSPKHEDGDKLALTKRGSTDLLEPDTKAVSKADDSGDEEPEERPLSDRGWHLSKDAIGNPLVEPLDNECA